MSPPPGLVDDDGRPGRWDLRSLGQREERLSFLDDIGGEFGRVAAADIPHCVDHSGRDGQDVTGVERLRRLAFDLILQRPFEEVDDLPARMRVLDLWRLGADVDARLDDRAPGNAETVLLEIGAPGSWCLPPRHDLLLLSNSCVCLIDHDSVLSCAPRPHASRGTGQERGRRGQQLFGGLFGDPVAAADEDCGLRVVSRQALTSGSGGLSPPVRACWRRSPVSMTGW